MKTKQLISILLRLTVAIILLQTLFFKFTAHPDSVHIFTALGVEPWGRITLGIVELITAVLILVPKTQVLGMFVSIGIIIGAIASHLLVLGVNVANDGGKVFALAIVVFIASAMYLWMHKEQVLFLLKNKRIQ